MLELRRCCHDSRHVLSNLHFFTCVTLKAWTLRRQRLSLFVQWCTCFWKFPLISNGRKHDIRGRFLSQLKDESLIMQSELFSEYW